MDEVRDGRKLVTCKIISYTRQVEIGVVLLNVFVETMSQRIGLPLVTCYVCRVFSL